MNHMLLAGLFVVVILGCQWLLGYVLARAQIDM
jgi:hypothetical protein